MKGGKGMDVKENCNDCYALIEDKCTLGYKIEPLYFSICYITEGYKPLEACPKPETKELYKKLYNERIE